MLIFNTKLTYTSPAGPRCRLLAAGLLGYLFLLSGLHGFSQPPSETDLNYYLSGSKNSPEVIRAARIHKELIYKYSFDKHNKADTVLTDSIIYNSDGQVIQSTEFIHLYQMKFTRKFFYDSLGRLQKTQEDLASFKGINWTLEYLYDSAGHQVYQGRHFDKDRLFLVSQRRVYDPDGKLIGIYQPYDFLQTQFFYSNSTGLL